MMKYTSRRALWTHRHRKYHWSCRRSPAHPTVLYDWWTSEPNLLANCPVVVETRHQNHNRWSHGGSKRKVRRSPNSVGFLWGPWMSVENFLVIEMFHSGQNWPTLPFLEPRLAKKMKTLWVRRIGSIYMCQVCFLERIVKVNLQHQ